jgi:hypothetical protein
MGLTSDKLLPEQQPLLPDVGVLALVPDTWSMVWQVRHQILTRLARYFHVVWADPALDWRARLNGIGRPYRPRVDSPPGFRIYAPEAWLPMFYRPSWLAGMTSRWRLERAKSLLARAGCEEILLSLWRPEFADAVRHLPSCRSSYHIDDEYSFSEVEVPLSRQECELIARVDQVFVSSPGLLLRKGDINRHTALVPNGVDYQAYATAHPEPSDLATIPRPRISYSGVLKRHLN